MERKGRGRAQIKPELSAYPQKCGGVQIAHLNCCSVLLRAHIEEIFNLMCNAQIDVLALSETWLGDTTSDHKIFPVGSGVSLV